VLRAVVHNLESRFHITHTTIQVEGRRLRVERHVLHRSALRLAADDSVVRRSGGLLGSGTLQRNDAAFKG